MAKAKRRTSQKDRPGTYERRLRLFIHVLTHGYAELSELTKDLGCHMTSLRGDIRYLEEQGPFIHLLPPDVVVSLIPVFKTDVLLGRLQTNLEQKATVAKKALEYIDERDGLFLSGGGTNFLLALEIARAEKRGISAVIGNLYMQHFLRGIDQLRVVKGRVSKGHAVIESEVSLEEMKEQGVTKAFLGVDALSWDGGAYCAIPNVDVQRDACFVARDLRVFLTDHGEVGKTGPTGCFVSFQELEEKGLPYLVICNKKVEDPELAKRVEEELAKFPEGRVVRA